MLRFGIGRARGLEAESCQADVENLDRLPFEGRQDVVGQLPQSTATPFEILVFLVLIFGHFCSSLGNGAN